MFTVMHQMEGGEYFYEAESVVYHGPFANPNGTLSIEVVKPSHSFFIQHGQAYVMNDHGATVGKYDLGGETKPVGTTGRLGGEASRIG